MYDVKSQCTPTFNSEVKIFHWGKHRKGNKRQEKGKQYKGSQWFLGNGWIFLNYVFFSSIIQTKNFIIHCTSSNANGVLFWTIFLGK